MKKILPISNLSQLKDYTVVKLEKEKTESNQYFSFFDQYGMLVSLQINNRIYDHRKPIDPKLIKQLQMKIRKDEVDEYLNQKNLAMYSKCHCLVHKNLIDVNYTQCIPSDCIIPKKIVKIQL